MKNTLILITSHFPYGKGETFLETEISFLSKQFEQIFIIPTKQASTDTKRELPNNCILDSSIIFFKNDSSTFKRIVSKLLTAFSSYNFFIELPNILHTNFNKSAIDNLLTYTWDAFLIKSLLQRIILKNSIQTDTCVIYSYWCNGATYGATLSDGNIPVISRVHRGDLYEELYPYNYIPYRQATFAKLKLIVPISQNGHEYLIKKYPLIKSKVKLFRLGITIPNSRKVEARKETEEFTVVSCSSINSNKRVLEIFESLNKLAIENSDKSIYWHHFGDGEMRSELKQKLKSSGYNFKAILHGYISNYDLMNWYSTNYADIFINFSKSEGIPVSIMEANSFGIPTIATDVGGTSELVTNKTGWLIDSSLIEKQIHESLSEIISNSQAVSQKRILAKQTCEQYFNAEVNYQKFAEALQNIDNLSIK